MAKVSKSWDPGIIIEEKSEHFWKMSISLWDMNNTKWSNGFSIEFRQSFAKETFPYDEQLQSYE